MFDSQLIETLRQLNDGERQQLDKFVHSKLFFHPDNTSGVIALFEELMSHAPLFDNVTALDRLQLAERLGKTPQYIAKTASNLHAVVRRFIGWAFREDAFSDFFDQLALLEFYQERNLPQRFENLYEKVERDCTNRVEHKNLEGLYQRFRLDKQQFEWMSRHKIATDLHLRATLDSFEAYYLLQKAQLTYILMLRNRNFPLDTEGYLSVLDDIERFCLRHTPEKQGLLLIYYEAILFILVWVESFLKDYQHRLTGTTQPQELFRLYYAYFLIFKGKLKEAEENLKDDFDSAIMRVEARCFDLMISYDNRSQLMEHKLESFRKLVRNTTGLPDTLRDGFHSFALTLRKMVNPDLKRNDKKIDKIMADIKTTPTSEFIWLIARLERLKSRR
jgi:hypothetical protein